MSEEDVKILAELKKDLEEKIMKMEKELMLLKTSLKLVDEALAKVSFKPASKIVEEGIEKKTFEETYEEVFQIKSKSGEDLGNIYVGKNIIKIVPREDLKLSIKTSPFQSFFIERVLEKMKKKDEEEVARKKKSPDEVIDYTIETDGDLIKEIIIRNVKDETRIREIRSVVRWTFERMLEKMSKTT
ncbi:MAG: hypothetical protein LM593_02615 [Candidatus Verstraetearchaeota archaeon]|jgi:hypothetical protein|nr:hypothetical protein [Candidatus Verstraetearchaeota archaeon]